MKYDWYERGVWIPDGHNWNLGVDIPKQPRKATGETVTLQPPPFGLEQGPSDLVCTVYWISALQIYIALGKYQDVPVLFYDKQSFETAYQRRYPNATLVWDVV